MFIAHSVALKGFVFGLSGTAGFFESIGLPAFLAYVVSGMEVVGSIPLVCTRDVAAALITMLVGALWVHAGNGWVFGNAGGGWEYPLRLTVLNGAQVLLSDGAFALARITLNIRGNNPGVRAR
jgi:putative oxidoreductase